MDSFHQGQLVADKYRLERLIARGGMGEIWHAHHLQLDAPVAIKFMDPQLLASPAARERFAREARAAAKIQSPHVVHVSDHGMDAETPYIVMELLRGEDLDNRLMRGTLPLLEAEKVMREAARALSKAHELGIVHRDLKPSNLFLTDDVDDWLLKIVDFGVAKALGAEQLPPMPPSNPGGGQRDFTQTGVVLGSPQYMSPEQARRFKNVDHRADVWALSAIMFRALTGKRLYEDLSAFEALARIVRGTPPVPSELAPELPAPLLGFFDRAMHRDINHRFQTAQELSRGFEAAVKQVRSQADQSSITGTTVPAFMPSSMPPPLGPSLPQQRASANRTIAVVVAAAALMSLTAVAAALLIRSDEPLMHAGEGLSPTVELEAAEGTEGAGGEDAQAPSEAVETQPTASALAPAPARRPGRLPAAVPTAEPETPRPKRSWGF